MTTIESLIDHSLHFLKDPLLRQVATCTGKDELFEYVIVSGWEEITEAEYQSLQADGWQQ